MTEEDQDLILPLLRHEGCFVFAVIDGAKVEGLQTLLHQLRLDPKPLYFSHKNGTGHAAGPHLLAVPSETATLRLRESVPAGAVVWWVWPGRDADDALAGLFRHLRGLGRVEIPAGYPDNTGKIGPPRYELVLFRHADPHVLAQVLPVLGPEQRSRLYGKARAIVIDDPQGSGLRIARVPEGLPPPPMGFLRLTTDQMDRITERRVAERQAVLVEYMLRNAPTETEMLSDAELQSLAAKVDLRAKELGLQEGSSLLLLGFLAAITGGAALTARQIEHAILRPDISPDDALMELVTQLQTESANMEAV